MPTNGPPGWFVTGTDTGVGKTVAAGALARVLRERGKRPGVFKPMATGCRRDPRLGLVSEDTEFLAHCAESSATLETITPVRYAAAVAPLVAAEHEKRPIDFDAIEDGFHRVRSNCDWMIVEGVGGLLVPLERRRSVADLAVEYGYPLIIVARPGLGTLNHTLLTIEAARQRKLKIAAVVINNYEPASSTLAEETNPEVISRVGRLRLPIIVPFDKELDVSKGRMSDAALYPFRHFVDASLKGKLKSEK
jgi:dethiobiotin synthetase